MDVMRWSTPRANGEMVHHAMWITVPCQHTCTGERIVTLENKLGRCSSRYCL